MEINLDGFKGKELFVRKKIVSFLEQIFMYLNLNLDNG